MLWKWIEYLFLPWALIGHLRDMVYLREFERNNHDREIASLRDTVKMCRGNIYELEESLEQQRVRAAEDAAERSRIIHDYEGRVERLRDELLMESNKVGHARLLCLTETDEKARLTVEVDNLKRELFSCQTENGALVVGKERLREMLHSQRDASLAERDRLAAEVKILFGANQNLDRVIDDQAKIIKAAEEREYVARDELCVLRMDTDRLRSELAAAVSGRDGELKVVHEKHAAEKDALKQLIRTLASSLVLVNVGKHALLVYVHPSVWEAERTDQEFAGLADAVCDAIRDKVNNLRKKS